MLGIILEGIDFFPDSQMQIKLPKQSNKYFYFDLVFFLLKIYFRTLTIRAGYLLKKAPCNLHRGSSSNKIDQQSVVLICLALPVMAMMVHMTMM